MCLLLASEPDSLLRHFVAVADRGPESFTASRSSLLYSPASRRGYCLQKAHFRTEVRTKDTSSPSEYPLLFATRKERSLLPVLVSGMSHMCRAISSSFASLPTPLFSQQSQHHPSGLARNCVSPLLDVVFLRCCSFLSVPLRA
jgi:hypothetical protein